MNKLTAVLMALVVLTVTSAMAVPQFAATSVKVLTSTTSDAITITGTVIDADGAGIELYCGGDAIGPFAIAEDGTFTVETKYGGINGCAPGTATLKVGETSTNVIIPEQLVAPPKGRDAPAEEEQFDISGMVLPTEVPPAGMPEFSTITLGMAVVGVGLGLVFLRKH